MKPNQSKSVDNSVASALSSRYAYQSRRSFMHRLSMAAFGLLGVSIAGEVPLFFVPEAKSQASPGNWIYCGLHGNACGSGCPSSSGTTFKWVTCCPDTTDCKLYHCCSYIDVCTSGAVVPSGCNNNVYSTPANSSAPWCGSIHDETIYGWSGYVCTIVSCDMGTGYMNPSDCAKNCGQSC
jgi:hypothetical protein